MYSRSRMAGGEDRYTENLPPVYNGNRFSYARREHVSQPPQETPPLHESAPIQPEEEIPCAEIPEAKESAAPMPPPQAGGLLGSIGQEELLLVALLLLLSAEHERSMDIIVILLLLIGIH